MSKQAETSTGAQVVGTIVVGLITIPVTCSLLLWAGNFDHGPTTPPAPPLVVVEPTPPTESGGTGRAATRRSTRPEVLSPSFGDIFEAAESGSVQDVEYFIKNGFGVNTTNKEGAAPLHRAAYRNNVAVVKYLDSQGANLHLPDRTYNATPLHWAAENKNVDVAKYLVSQGADVRAKNGKGLTPHEHAVEVGNTEVVKYLAELLPPRPTPTPPPPPVLPVKLDTPTVTVSATGSNEIRVTWNPISNAGSYDIQYATNASFTRNVDTVRSTSTSHDITRLDANTTYYVRVMATSIGRYSNSDYSIVKSTTTVKRKLEAPSIVDGRWKRNEIGVVWTRVNNADRYTIEYTTDRSFNTGIRTVSAGPLSTSTSITGLNANTTYHVRIKAIGAGFTDSDYSATAWFQTSR